MKTIRVQSLVNAQTEVNRAVFEANQPRPRAEYIRARILQAQVDLSAALQPEFCSKPTTKGKRK